MGTTKQSPKKRNVSWDMPTDDMAVELAMRHRLRGGVSELLSRLVAAEAKRKRGIARLHPVLKP